MGGVRPGRVFVGWFALVVLYTALTEAAPLSGALGLGTRALAALSDPSRPLIRDHTGGGTQSAGAGKGAQTAPYTGSAPSGTPNPGGSPTEGTTRSAPAVTPGPNPLPSFLQQHQF